MHSTMAHRWEKNRKIAALRICIRTKLGTLNATHIGKASDNCTAKYDSSASAWNTDLQFTGTIVLVIERKGPMANWLSVFL